MGLLSGDGGKETAVDMVPVEPILNYQVAALPPRDCVAALRDRITQGPGENGSPFWLACLNPHSVRMAMTDPEAAAALKAADVLVPDGVGIVIASRVLGGGIQERITGSDVFRELSVALNEFGKASYFFLGSKESTLQAIQGKLAEDFPRIRCAGAYSPPFAQTFSDAETRAMIEAVNKAAPDVLWVGMTAPKQEKWIYWNKNKLNVRFIGAVGAVFDFYTGNVKRSHPWFLDHGLEWLPRLVQEPRRLWSRTLVSAPVFFWHVLKQKTQSFRQV